MKDEKENGYSLDWMFEDSPHYTYSPLILGIRRLKGSLDGLNNHDSIQRRFATKSERVLTSTFTKYMYLSDHVL